jgi:hypothetical protein
MKKVCITPSCPKLARAKGICGSCESRARHAKNPERSRPWIAAHSEHISVRTHYHLIRNGDQYYRGMPFYAGWNPDKGGSYGAGAEWIIANLGRRPDKTYQLHIVDRLIGFMPENLQWVHRSKHQQEEVVAKLRLEIQKLRRQLKYLFPDVSPSRAPQPLSE